MNQSKVISLSDEVYETLSKLKRGGESFSELFKRMSISKKHKSLLDLEGAIKDPHFEEAMKIVLKKRSIRSKNPMRF